MHHEVAHIKTISKTETERKNEEMKTETKAQMRQDPSDKVH